MTPGTVPSEPMGWASFYRCGCSLVTKDHPHPKWCPYHAPDATGWADSHPALTVEARAGRLAPTEPFYSEPAMWGLLVEDLSPVISGTKVGQR